MKIDRNSWMARWYHYQSQSYYGQDNLCTFIKYTIFKPLILGLVSVGLLFLMGLGIFTIFQHFWSVQFIYKIIILSIILFGIGMIILINIILKSRINKIHIDAGLFKIIGEYLKALKNKTCPFIEFVDK